MAALGKDVDIISGSMAAYGLSIKKLTVKLIDYLSLSYIEHIII